MACSNRVLARQARNQLSSFRRIRTIHTRALLLAAVGLGCTSVPGVIATGEVVITGCVVDSWGGAKGPLENAHVALRRGGQTMTDAVGFFRLIVPAGQFPDVIVARRIAYSTESLTINATRAAALRTPDLVLRGVPTVHSQPNTSPPPDSLRARFEMQYERCAKKANANAPAPYPGVGADSRRS